MKKAITVLGLGAAAVAISVSNASAMEGQTTTSINLREQPSATSNKVSELHEGANLKVVKNHNGWSKVETEDGQSGWVSGYYVSDKDGNSINSQNQNLQKKKVEEQKVNDNVNNINNKNAEINKSNTNNLNSEIKNTEVNSNIKKTEGAQSGVNSNAKITSTSSLNVRVGPSVSNGVSGIVYKGEIFKVVSKSSNGWYKVVLNDGTIGWVSGKYINLTSEQDKTNIAEYNNNAKQNENNKQQNNSEAITADQGKVNSSVGLNVRSGAGTNNSVITTLTNNSIVSILGEENGWYKVRLENDTIGYVGANYISKTGNTVQVNENNSVAKTDSPTNKKERNENTTTTPKNSGNILNVAQSLLGTKYVWGGTSTSGFDCSGFTQYVYKNALGVNIPRVSSAQATAGKAVSMNSIKSGDLLYFDTNGSGKTSHVGIYLGNGKFIHASGTATNPEYVKVSNLNEKWVKCLGARRF